MSKIRVIPTLLVKGFGLVKGVGFDSWRPVGSIMQAVKVYNMREVDELVLLDVAATPEDRSPDVSLVDDVADECFMPLAVGGGIRTVEDVRNLLRVGADKVVIGTAAMEKPGLVQAVARKFGSQCVVASVDFRRDAGGRPEVHVRSGSRATGRDPVEWARVLEAQGAGEILLQSVDRDGTMGGYDVEVTRKVADAVSIPVIASGGAGSFEDMVRVVKEGGASAVAAASIYHFTHLTPMGAKQYLRGQGLAVRI